jgi:hypothetical protein
MTTVTPIDRARQALTVLFAVGQVAATFVPTLTGYGRPLGDDHIGVAPPFGEALHADSPT